MTLKQEIAKAKREKLAGYYYDLSKLTFGALVIGGLAPYLLGTTDCINWVAIIIGGGTSALFAMVGNNILKG